jgi:F-type H+-transporting ATPase subunit gamma
VSKVGLLLITSDRGLAGAFNSQINRAGFARARQIEGDGAQVSWYASGRRGVSTLGFRGHEVIGSYTGFTDRPSYADARNIAGDVTTAYVDGDIDRLELIYNHYVSPMTQTVSHETLLPLQQADILGGEEDEGEEPGRGQRSPDEGPDHSRALWIYEPDPEEILARLVPDYVEISIYRALLESTASEHGARMTAMRNASENASELIDDLTLEMNRQRQAEITQEIMEVVAGAEGLR